MSDDGLTRRQLLAGAGGIAAYWGLRRLTSATDLVTCALDSHLDPAPPAQALDGPYGPPSIEKVVIILLENHTFDNIAGDVRGADVMRRMPLASAVEDGTWNGLPAWEDRSVRAKRKRFTREELPTLYTLMDSYTVSDRFFTDVAGPSFPNHLFAVMADNCGITDDPKEDVTLPDVPTMPLRLEEAGRTWANYGGDNSFTSHPDPRMSRNQRSAGDLADDARNGRLPDVSWVFPGYGYGYDFHPANAPIQNSDNWLREAIQGIADGQLADGRPLWDHVQIFITFDDWGGWYDHVTPPVVEHLDGMPIRYGGRVPLISVGPYAKPGHVSHQLGSHTSMLAFIERHFGLRPLNHRTASPREHGLSDTVDLRQKPRRPPVWLSNQCTRDALPEWAMPLRHAERIVSHELTKGLGL